MLGLMLFLIPLIMQTMEVEKDDLMYTALASASRQTPQPNEHSLPSASNSKVTGQQMLQPEAVVPTLPTESATSEDSPPGEESTTTPPITACPIETGRPDYTQSVNIKELLEKNADFIAWLNIPNTPIDYPVVMSSNSDYYLHHCFDGTKSKLGCLFSLPSSDYATPSRNIAIYGHHLSNSHAMFSSLLDYKDKRYWEQHPIIVLDTIYGKRTYQIFAVLNMHIYSWDPSTAHFVSDTAFRHFVQYAQTKAMYETHVDVQEDAHLLTLITCDRSYGGVSGRLIVMAVEQEKERSFQ